MNRYWLFLFSAVLISATSQLFLKKGAEKKYDNFLQEYLNPYVIFGYVLMVVSTILVIFSYRGVDYKNGPIIESFGFIIVMILSALILKEKLTKTKIIGNLIIILGIIVFYM